MNNEILALFTSHYSVGESILTVEKEEKIKDDSSVSIFAIAKEHGEDGVFIVESDIAGYWKAYKNAKDLGLQMTFGLKMVMCADVNDKSPESKLTESSIIIVFKNTQAFTDLVPIYSFASTLGKNDYRRLDWKNLTELSDNFFILVPFYSSFIARNLLNFKNVALPDFGKLKPRFLNQKQGMPFDSLIERKMLGYCEKNGYEVMPAHQIYYYKDEDVMAHLTFNCIGARRTWEKPNFEHYCSNQFSYESYRRSIQQPI